MDIIEIDLPLVRIQCQYIFLQSVYDLVLLVDAGRQSEAIDVRIMVDRVDFAVGNRELR